MQEVLAVSREIGIEIKAKHAAWENLRELRKSMEGHVGSLATLAELSLVLVAKTAPDQA